ncbi:MAG: hypothetical protein J6Y94_05405 [Bacteriovoracaceae bacterium]|nr:hypothetical protein [Bacteriovoracaceae bacterium]
MFATEEENARKHYLNQLATKLLTKRNHLRLIYSPERNFQEDAMASYEPPTVPGEEHYLNIDNLAPFRPFRISPVLWHEFIHASTGTVFYQQRPYPFYGVMLFDELPPRYANEENADIFKVLFFDESTAYFRGGHYELQQLRHHVRDALKWPPSKDALNEFKVRLGKVISSLEYCWEYNWRQAQLERQVLQAIEKGKAQLIVFPLYHYAQVYQLLNSKLNARHTPAPKFTPGEIFDEHFAHLTSEEDYYYFLMDGTIFPQDGDLKPYLYAKIVTKSPAGTLYLAFPRIFPKEFKKKMPPAHQLLLAKKEVTTYLAWAAQVATHQKRETAYVLQSLQELEDHRSTRKRLNPQLLDYLSGLNGMLSSLHKMAAPTKKIHLPTTAELDARFQENYRQARLGRK